MNSVAKCSINGQYTLLFLFLKLTSLISVSLRSFRLSRNWCSAFRLRTTVCHQLFHIPCVFRESLSINTIIGILIIYQRPTLLRPNTRWPSRLWWKNLPNSEQFFPPWPENRPFSSETARRPYQSLWQPGREARELTHLVHWTLVIDFNVPTTPRSPTISINSVRIPCTRSEQISDKDLLTTEYKVHFKAFILVIEYPIYGTLNLTWKLLTIEWRFRFS